jgi:D-glycero-alpha-D-manno-heptose-7-phosphate kinase
MIIARSPFRISYFGGGTDFPQWFKENNYGKTISTTIDKYCYVILRTLPSFFPFQYRLRYYKTEQVKKLSRIKHPTIKNALEFYHSKELNNLEIIHFADLPALSGLGASSAFSSCLIKAIIEKKNLRISKKKLSEQTVFLEKNLMGEFGGYQDNYATSYGGFNEIIYDKKKIIVKEYKDSNKLKILEKNTIIFFTGISRIGNNIEKKKIEDLNKKLQFYKDILEITEEANELIKSKNSFNFLNNFSLLLKKSWELKKNLNSKVSSSKINQIYNHGIKNGALAGKILGAGGGGFIMFIIDSKKTKEKVKESLKNLIHVDFNFEKTGTTIINKNNSI